MAQHDIGQISIAWYGTVWYSGDGLDDGDRDDLHWCEWNVVFVRWDVVDQHNNIHAR